MDRLSQDTSLALLQSTQTVDLGKAAIKSNSAKGGVNVSKAEEAAQEFEAVFIAEMLKPMFEGIKHDGEFGGGKGEEVFHGMLVEEYGKLLAQTGGIGVADSVRDTMIQMQAEADAGGRDKTNAQVIAQKNDDVTTGLTNGEQNATSNE